MQSYNSSAWRPQGGFNDPSNNQQAGPSYYRQQPMGTVPELYNPYTSPHRSHSEGPSPPPIPPLPPSLTPGRQRGRSTASPNQSSYFFEQPNGNFPTPRHPRHTQSLTANIGATSPPVPRRPWQPPQAASAPPIPPHPQQIAFNDTFAPRPAVPPKLSFYSQSISGFASTSYSNEPLPPEDPRPYSFPISSNGYPQDKPQASFANSPPESEVSQAPQEPPRVAETGPKPQSQEDREMALAIAQSLQENKSDSSHLTAEQREDEELARALEESRLLAEGSSATVSSSLPLDNETPDYASGSQLDPPRMRSLPTSPLPSSSHLGDNMTGVPREDEFPFTSSPRMLNSQISDDEALARRLASGIEDSLPPEPSNSAPPERIAFPTPQIPGQPNLPLYSPAISSIVNSPELPTTRLSTSSTFSHEQPPTNGAEPEDHLSRHNSVRSAVSQKSAASDARSRLSGTQPESSLVAGLRPQSHAFAVSSISMPIRVESPPEPAPGSPGLDESYFAPSRRPLSSQAALPVQTSMDQKPRPVSLSPNSPGQSSGDYTPHAFGANQFVERELLQGISLGFTAPAISSMLTPLQGAMPNIITLPFGKSPPLHIQAPTWRHLLKLMAKLSGTRIEPTPEAIAISKGELKLRTVVQFVRVHRSSQDWRTILYLSLDYPVPTNAPNSWKYINSDVSTLPYSYTLSTLPTLLRDGCDNAISTYYTIPSTNRTPFPTLPIAFPDMAMYLQSAIDDSRKAMNDSSSGLRKLAKSVDTYYPNNEPIGIEDAPDKRSFWKFGRSKNKNNRGGNEEVFELVTPFLAEGY